MTKEVHIVMTRFSIVDPDKDPQRRQVELSPAIYDLDVGPTLGAQMLAHEESPRSLSDYVDIVGDDMVNLLTSITMEYANEWVAKRENPEASTSFSADRTEPRVSDLYVRLLVGFAGKHHELLSNMLASVLVGSITSTASDPSFADRYQQWVRSVDCDETVGLD